MLLTMSGLFPVFVIVMVVKLDELTPTLPNARFPLTLIIRVNATPVPEAPTVFEPAV